MRASYVGTPTPLCVTVRVRPSPNQSINAFDSCFLCELGGSQPYDARELLLCPAQSMPEVKTRRASHVCGLGRAEESREESDVLGDGAFFFTC